MEEVPVVTLETVVPLETKMLQVRLEPEAAVVVVELVETQTPEVAVVVLEYLAKVPTAMLVVMAEQMVAVVVVVPEETTVRVEMPHRVMVATMVVVEVAVITQGPKMARVAQGQ